MQRRGFLGGLAMAGSALAESTIRAAVVTDSAAIHLNHFLEGLAGAEGIAQVALAGAPASILDRCRRQLGPHGPNLQVFDHEQDLFARFRPHLTIATLEPARMAEVAHAALDASSHVMIEKPGCARLEQLMPAIETAGARGLHLMLALPTRFGPACVKARELIAAGSFGKPYGADMTWIADQTRLRNPAYHRSWLASRARAGGGKLIFHGIHYLDLIEHLSGSRITRISAICRNVGGQPMDVEDAAIVTARLACGMSITLNAGYYLDKGYANGVAFWGSKGRLRLDLTGTPSLEWHAAGGLAQRWPYSLKPSSYELMMHDTVRSIRSGSRPFMTASDTLHILRVCFGAYRAAANGMMETV